MKKKNIAIIAGGFTREASVSRKGAQVVENNIDNKLYNVYKIFIYKNKWYHKTKNGTEIQIDKNDFTLLLNGKKVKFDCVFNVIHGTPGEDGKIQGYFDLLGIPYTNSNQVASAITYNKYTTGLYADYHGVKVPRSVLLKSPQSTVHSQKKRKKTLPLIPSQEGNIMDLGFPMIVKPNNGGSSIGMSKIVKMQELKTALQKAFKEDEEVLLQEFIKGTEITCGMIRKNGKIIALPLTEVVPKTEFFDYVAKYSKGKSEEITPARVSKEVENECKRLSMMIYDKLNCKGMVRMDYIVRHKTQDTRSKTKDEKQKTLALIPSQEGNKFELYLLDINTVPGLSSASIIPQQARVAGIKLSELYNIVINEAIR